MFQVATRVQSIEPVLKEKIKKILPPAVAGSEPIDIIAVGESAAQSDTVFTAGSLALNQLARDPAYPVIRTVTPFPGGFTESAQSPCAIFPVAVHQSDGRTVESLALLRQPGATERQYQVARALLLEETDKVLGSWAVPEEPPALGPAAEVPAGRTNELERKTLSENLPPACEGYLPQNCIELPHDTAGTKKFFDQLSVSLQELLTTNAGFAIEDVKPTSFGYQQVRVSPVEVMSVSLCREGATPQVDQVWFLRHPNASRSQYEAARDMLVDAANQHFAWRSEPTIAPFPPAQ